ITETIKEHFQGEANQFDELINKVIPYYPEMINALVAGIPFPESTKIKVLDLGAGTGTISLKVKEKFPNSQINFTVYGGTKC
ncbi:MAG: hypothetical protein WC860_02175, partial [Candidatus Margulisiibacteriota bacterium]